MVKYWANALIIWSHCFCASCLANVLRKKFVRRHLFNSQKLLLCFWSVQEILTRSTCMVKLSFFETWPTVSIMEQQMSGYHQGLNSQRAGRNAQTVPKLDLESGSRLNAMKLDRDTVNFVLEDTRLSTLQKKLTRETGSLKQIALAAQVWNVSTQH